MRKVGKCLKITDPETCRLAEELAKLTGEDIEDAVTAAVRERLNRLPDENGETLSDRLLLIGKDCAAHLEEPVKSVNIDDLLYDERGLPRED